LLVVSTVSCEFKPVLAKSYLYVVTSTVDATGLTTVTCAVPDTDGFCTETAPIVNVDGDVVILVGAAYSPAELIVPVDEDPPVTPFTCHVTAVFEALVTVALNC
jgi:hypothetical protein